VDRRQRLQELLGVRVGGDGADQHQPEEYAQEPDDGLAAMALSDRRPRSVDPGAR
jgi:hypothetical protein